MGGGDARPEAGGGGGGGGGIETLPERSDGMGVGVG